MKKFVFSLVKFIFISIIFVLLKISLTKSKTNSINLTIQTYFGENYFKSKHLSGQYDEIKSQVEKEKTKSFEYKINEIYFLITTNTKRIRQTCDFIRFWSNENDVRCLLLFEENDFLSKIEFAEYLRNKQIFCQLKLTKTKIFEQRYFELIKEAFNLTRINSNIKWIALSDDDTIWFIKNLLTILGDYDHSKLIYLGNISDRNQSILYHGSYFAYGGGGILLSKSLIRFLMDKYHLCQKYILNYGGDEILGMCLHSVFKFNLTTNKHFHQIDHQGDLHGFLQSGIQGLVTLHHMFSWWYPFPPEHTEHDREAVEILHLSYLHFDLLFLKNFVKFNLKMNQTYLFTVGYSFTIFNRILSFEELNQVEVTWCCNSHLNFKTTRKTENKTIWFFKNIKTSQFYLNSSIYQFYSTDFNENHLPTLQIFIEN